MSRFITRLEKLESHSPSNIPIVRMKTFDDTRENVERQIAEESTIAEANGETLIAITYVPHIGETTNEFRKTCGLNPLDIPGWDKPRRETQGN